MKKLKKRRSDQWEDGRRNGIKWAVTYLHSRAKEMNDTKAMIVLDSAAFNMGWQAKHERPPRQVSELVIDER